MRARARRWRFFVAFRAFLGFQFRPEIHGDGDA